MRKYFGVLLLLGYISFPISLFSQLDIYRFIGKSHKELIKDLGKPAHIDNTNQSMIMIFYKSPGITKSFVADEAGIYQTEATQAFDTEKSCKAALNLYKTDLINKGFSVDSVSALEFNCGKTGVGCNFNYGFNELTKKYVIYVTARRRES